MYAKMSSRKEGILNRKDIIIMNLKELKRLKVIQDVIGKNITQKTAAEILELSTRQIGRIAGRVKREGEAGIIHKSRGRPSSRKIPEKIKEEVINLYQKKYPDFGPTFAVEKLFEADKIKLSKETLRKWLKEAGLITRQRKSRKHRHWRPRCECFGQMVQMDGSHHPWLEGRGPELVLMTYIDDATGKTFARFYDYEGTFPAMDSFKAYIKRYSLPQLLYVDKHSTYRSKKKQTIEEELEGRPPLSQFERALDELGVGIIHANSPQAKGRVERVLRTFQDRLIKEMRLKGVKSKEEANRFLEEYLPKFNQRFALEPANSTNLHSPKPKQIVLDKILSVKAKRVLRKDFTISYNKRFYQIIDIPLGVRIKYVTLEERLNGKIYISYNGFYLKFKQIEARMPNPKISLKQRKVYIPPKDHPWKKFRLPGSLNFEEKEEALAMHP